MIPPFQELMLPALQMLGAAGLHQKIILIDGRRLAELMIEHGIGVAEEHAYSVKKIDSDYFEES
jgi:restriction system protein